ncbi:MAG: hypothetical protein QG670_1945 [Thermoproteota archaeon]|nr:hypothetical protein [Thermoproteota archaeon]
MTEKTRKILFICTGNIDRSPTAEALFKGKPGFEVRSAGTSSRANRRLTSSLINWADTIFTMEECHKKAILTISPKTEKKITVLNIPDIFSKDDPELVRILKVRLPLYLKTEW